MPFLVSNHYRNELIPEICGNCLYWNYTSQKMRFSINDFSRKCDYPCTINLLAKRSFVSEPSPLSFTLLQFLVTFVDLSKISPEPIFSVHWILHWKKGIQLHEQFSSSQRNVEVHLKKWLKLIGKVLCTPQKMKFSIKDQSTWQ